MRLRLGILFYLIGLCCTLLRAQDRIIFRDGRELAVKIIQTNNDKTLYKATNEKNAAEEFVENNKVFMLKFKSRGNVVFNSNGERILTVSEPTKIPKNAIVIYYKDGREIPAQSITMDEHVVFFKPLKSKGGKASDALLAFKPKELKKKLKEQAAEQAASPTSIPRCDIFMIRYPDGTRDILTNLADEEERERIRQAEEAERKKQAEAEQKSSAENESESASTQSLRKATIITRKGVRIKAWIISDTASTLTYKKENTPKAAIFRMSKAKIKKVVY